MYKLKNEYMASQVIGQIIVRDNGDGSTSSFGKDPANTDYQNFKKQINADEAQLEDADGNLMTADQAKEFVRSLPCQP